MKLRMHARWRILAAGAVTCAAALVPGVALASPGAPAGTARAATPACPTSGLDVWLNTQGDGASGTIYYDLEFTNLSGSSCALFGYPGVSAVTLTGAQVGNAARRDNSFTPHLVTLANGATATAMVGITQTGFFTKAQCKRVTAAGLRVYPPGQTASKIVPFPFGACAKTGTNYLSVMVVR
jgi:hypothetical protein